LAPLSPAAWKLPPNLAAPASADPRVILQADERGESPLPLPCLAERRGADGSLKGSVRRSFDAAGRPLRVLREDLNGTSDEELAYTLDGEGRVVGIERTAAGEAERSERDFDTAGRLSREAWSGGGCRSYVYDDAGRLARIRTGEERCGAWTSFERYAYDGEATRPRELSLCADEAGSECSVRASLSYDDRGLLVGVRREDRDLGNAAWTLVYDARGLLTELTEQREAATLTEQFHYDEAGGRLEGWTTTLGSRTTTTTLSYECPSEP